MTLPSLSAHAGGDVPEWAGMQCIAQQMQHCNSRRDTLQMHPICSQGIDAALREPGTAVTVFFFFFLRLNKFKECNVSSQATAWFKK